MSKYFERKIESKTVRMKPFFIVPRDHTLLRAALLECGGGRGSYFDDGVH